LALATVSDGFVYLGLQRTLDLTLTAFPLLFVGSATAFMVLAIPAGRLADRIGRRAVFLGGHVLLLGVYGSLLVPWGGLPLLAFALIGLGAYYAATDGVLQAIASALLPDRLRGSGLALLVTATSVAKLGSSVAFGLAWTLGGLQMAAATFGAALLVALAFAAWMLRAPEGAFG
jgi:MFS family permease